MTYKVEWSKAAAKQLLKIPKKQRLILVSWVKNNLEGCADPRLVMNGKQLQGTDCGWRWRIGSYRILGRIDFDKLTNVVVRVGHGQGVYNNLPDM